MSDHMVFQGCSDREKEDIRSYWQRKRPRIERLLTRFPEDQRELRLTATHGLKRYDVHAVLLLPTGSLAAEVSSPSEREAIDLATDKLIVEIRRHRELIRHDDLYRRKQQRQELSQNAAAVLRPDSHGPDRKAFFIALNPLIARLRNHARHELVVAELQGRIGHEQMMVADLLDEVILRAWTQFNARQEAEPLDVWLMRLFHEVFDEQFANVRATRSLSEQVDTGGSAEDTAIGFASEDALAWEEPLTLTFEDILPSHDPTEPWEPLAAVDQMKWVLAQLSTMPASQRRAFTLHLLEGWEPDEIAMIQSRSVEEVRTDIETVRQILRSRLDSESQVHRSKSAR